MRRTTTNIGVLALGALSFFQATAAVPTWPSSSDEVEDIMMLNDGFNARQFAVLIEPCTIEKEPGRSIAGGLIRTAFHDAAPHNSRTGEAGVDGSIGFELDSSIYPTNTGPAFGLAMTFYQQFFNSRASMADLVAVGLYQAVRGCGGPVVSVRTGRVDATGPGPVGVPEPTDPTPKLIGDFRRMGFTPEEMIQVVACGHTIGGVHSEEHPDIVPPGTTPVGTADLDSTNHTFDATVLNEFLDGTTKNPLVVGANPIARSDGRVFGLDGNKTVSSMRDPGAFAGTCSWILQKMLDTVPSSVKLTDPVVAYDLKPGNLQLNVGADGETLDFSGELRIRTNDLPSSSISKVQVIYTDRKGAKSCGDCSIDASSVLGEANGWDDTFTFYGFDGSISAETSISSFTVLVTLTDGSTKYFDNNGAGYPVQDKILAQTSNSALAGADSNGNQQLTVFAAVRTGETYEPVNLDVSLIIPRENNTLPTVSTTTNAMTSVCASKFYTFYSATFGVPTAAVNSTKYDVSAGSYGATVSDSFKSLIGLQASANAPACSY